MFYYVYKITNEINNKIYIGCHKTENIDDEYVGSGLVLKRAIKKYGIENFTKEILASFDNPDDMYAMESILVNEDFINNKNTYNLRLGGNGGFDFINQTQQNIYGTHQDRSKENLQKGIDIIREKFKDPSWKEKQLEKMRQAKIKKYGSDMPPPSFKGKKHSNESKVKIGKSNSKYQSGKGNANYGNCWIYSLKEQRNKIIRKEELQEWLDKGWHKGRKMCYNKKK